MILCLSFFSSAFSLFFFFFFFQAEDGIRDKLVTGVQTCALPISSTYFEGQAEGNPQAQRGYSRDHRPDCKQVNIALVVSRCGMPLGYEVFAGNRHDATTLE